MKAAAAPKVYVRTGNADISIAAEGIKFNSMKGSTANPVSPPQGKTFTSNRDSSVKHTLFNVSESWRYEQVLGRWFGPGASMLFAKIKLPVPEGIKKTFDNQPDFVKKEDFQDWLQSAELKLDGEADILAWLEYFAGCKIKKDDTFKNKKNNVEILHYVCTDNYKDLYYVADPESPERKYVLLFELERKADMPKSMKNIQAIAGTCSFFSPKKNSLPDDKKLVTRNAVDIKDRSPEYLASRDKVIAEIKNLDGWWYVETENYIFTANIKNRKLVDEIQLNVERCRSVFENYFPKKEPFSAIGVVKSFESRDEFLKYINAPDTYAYVGVWYPAKGELLLSSVSDNKKNNREVMSRCLMHEVFHQYMYNACGIVIPAPWFNEGFSIFFEGLEFKKNEFDVNLRESRLARFNKKGGISKKILEDVIYKGYSDINDRDSMLNFEARIWALTYFIAKGAPVMNKKEYAAIPFKYYDAVYRSKDSAKATTEAWDGIDLDAFSKDMAEFYSNKKLMNKAKKYDIMKNKELPKDENTPDPGKKSSLIIQRILDLSMQRVNLQLI